MNIISDRGNNAISNLLSYILFSIGPVLIDILIAVCFFCLQFDMYFGLIIFSTMVLYIYVTIIITEWRTSFRREANDLDNATKYKVF